jgi:hypothetical protein
MLKLIAALLLLAATPVLADDLVIPPVAYPRLPAHAATFDGFVPKGWMLQMKATGDLNGDGLPDAVLALHDAEKRNVLKNTGGMGDDPFDSNPHILAVVFARKGGGYDLALENHTLAVRPDQPTQQDPLDPNGEQAGGIAIRHGAFAVTLGYFSSAGGWDMGHMTFTFRFQDGRFALIGYDSVNVARNSGTDDETSIDYATGRMKTTASHIDSDAAGVVSWKTLPRKTLRTIQQIGDGVAFDPKG